MRLQTLGSLQLEGSDLRRPKPLLLLAYLALQGPTAKRHLAELFFPESKDRADALATTLARLRHHGVPTEGHGKVVSTVVACDAVLFEGLMQGGAYGEALALYRGFFGKGLELSFASELEEWLLAKREGLAALAREAHLTLAEGALTSGDLATARQHGEAAYGLEAAPPLDASEIPRVHRVLGRAQSGLLAQLRAEAADLDLPLPDLRAGTPHNLPTVLTHFLGRDLERLELANVLQEPDGRLITLHGPGGIGKTRLALQVAADHLTSPRFGDGVFFVPLDGLVSPAQLLPAVAQALGVADEIALPEVAAIAQVLGARQLLVVLDNFEHLVAASPLLPRLLEACPNLSLLVTSRERLNLKAEWVLTLAGLDLPKDKDAGDPGRALLSDAVQLFLARARRAQLGFTLGAGDLPQVLRICRAVGGFPLGLELAAAWVKTYPLEELAAELEANAAALETPHQDVRERHRSVGAAFSYSWRQLEPALQGLLLRLAVFQGGFELDAAKAVSGATPDALARLTDKALLQVGRTGRTRYTFHALLHQFLARKLSDDPGLEREVSARHGAFYSGVLARLNAAASGGASPELLGFMEREESNLVVVLDWALRTNTYGALTALAEPLLWHLPVQGRFKEAVRLCERVLAALPASDPAARLPRAAFLTSYSFVKLFAGSSAEAAGLAQEALALTEGVQEGAALQEALELQRLRALDTLGQVYTRLGDFGASVHHMERAEHIARRYGDPVRLLRTLTNLGIAYTGADVLAKGLTTFEEAQALYRDGRVGKGMDVIALCIGYGFGLMLAAQYPKGMQVLDEGLLLAEELGARGQQPVLSAIRAVSELEYALDMGLASDLTAVERRCLETLPTTKARGEILGHVLFLGALARCELEKGRRREALVQLAEACDVAWENRNVVGFLCILPYVLDAAFAVSKLELAGEIVGFMSVPKQVGSWCRGRGERAVRGWASDERAVQVFEVGLERGRTLPLPELAQRILIFTKQSQQREAR